MDAEYVDGVAAIAERADGPAPTVFAISDAHGYWGAFESALSLPGDHEDFAPLVERDARGRLHWAGGADGREYVLVCNGDLFDRGGDGERVVETVRRLQREAPDGHVRYLLGNHEQFLLAGGGIGPPSWYCNEAGVAERRRFFDAIAAGDVALAYDGYAYTYSHAGAPDGVDAAANEALRDVAANACDILDDEIAGQSRQAGEAGAFRRTFDDARVTRAGSREPTAADGGPLWLGWRHLPADAPPQVVGHTPQERVTRKGNVVCIDVIRENAERPGGEALAVETPDGLHVLERDADGEAVFREI